MRRPATASARCGRCPTTPTATQRRIRGIGATLPSPSSSGPNFCSRAVSSSSRSDGGRRADRRRVGGALDQVGAYEQLALARPLHAGVRVAQVGQRRYADSPR